ncbi:sirtuin 5 [Auricularia subglabra TFB-10046 SS5]|nr:sirtuin 5 [Auricularia subglabra TFB-10046 SS5]
MAPSSDVQAFRQVLRQSRHIVAVTGAGLSAGSGITTWRGEHGAWLKGDVSKLAHPQAFAEDPIRVWQFYHAIREAVMHTEPNAAHLALAMLRVPSLRAMLAPLARFTLVTQNIDGLCSRAGSTVLQQQQQSQASDPVVLDAPLYEMHGRVLDTLCTGCGACEQNLTSPLISLFAANSVDPVQCSLVSLPHCQECKELLRPGVVWFEEIPHHLREIWAAVDEADLCLVIGTSSLVYPAAAFAHEVSGRGKVAIFNLSRTEGDGIADFLFLGPCAETLPRTLFDISSKLQ